MVQITIDKLQEILMMNVMARAPAVDDSRYGEPQRPNIEGRHVTVDYGGETVQYIVPRDSAWTAGTGALQIDRAFRIFDEGQASAHLREVRNTSELESAAAGYYESFMKQLDSNRD